MPERNYFYRQPPIWHDLRTDISHWAIISAPDTPSVSVDFAKRLARIDQSYEDDLVLAEIQAAEAMIERETWSAIGPQVWQCNFYNSHRTFELPNPPLRDTSQEESDPFKVEYLDTTSTLQTLDASYYTLDTISSRLIMLKDWPAIVNGRPDAVRITYGCGYATDYYVPTPLKMAIAHLTDYLLRNRGGVEDFPPIVERLISPFKRVGIV